MQAFDKFKYLHCISMKNFGTQICILYEHNWLFNDNLRIETAF